MFNLNAINDKIFKKVIVNPNKKELRSIDFTRTVIKCSP